MPKKKKTSIIANGAHTTAAASSTPSSTQSPPPIPQSTPADFPKKLAPIYEALDAGHLRPALKLLTAFIAKHGRRPLLLTLLALTQVRLEARAEAAALIDEVAATHPTDTHLLSTLALVYRHLDQLPRIPPLYEAALSALPPGQAASEELLLALFHAYAAVHAHGAAQRTAMKLYSQHKAPHYLFYSLVHHLLPLPPTPAPHPLLLLSERMIRRGCPPSSLRSDDVDLLAAAIRQQADPPRLLAFLHSPDAAAHRALWPEEWGRQVATAHTLAGQPHEAREVWEGLALRHEADWHYVTHWLASHVDALPPSPPNPSDPRGEVERLQHVRGGDRAHAGGRDERGGEATQPPPRCRPPRVPPRPTTGRGGGRGCGL